MLEIIEEVVETENTAERLVADAREAAQRDQASFEAEERQRLQKAKSDADARVLERLAQIRQDVDAAYQKRVADARAQADRFLTERASGIEDAAKTAEQLVRKTAIQMADS